MPMLSLSFGCYNLLKEIVFLKWYLKGQQQQQQKYLDPVTNENSCPSFQMYEARDLGGSQSVIPDVSVACSSSGQDKRRLVTITTYYVSHEKDDSVTRNNLFRSCRLIEWWYLVQDRPKLLVLSPCLSSAVITGAHHQFWLHIFFRNVHSCNP